MKIGGNVLVISGEDMDLSNKAEEKIACEYTGNDIVIGFNAKFFQEMLTHVDTANVRIELSQPNRAAVILPIEESETDEKLFMLISPVMLNNY